MRERAGSLARASAHGGEEAGKVLEASGIQVELSTLAADRKRQTHIALAHLLHLTIGREAFRVSQQLEHHQRHPALGGEQGLAALQLGMALDSPGAWMALPPASPG